MTLEERKASARIEARARRDGAHEAALHDSPPIGEALRDVFLATVTPRPDAIVSGYWPVRGEMDPLVLLAHLHSIGHRCGLPVMVGRERPLVFRQWHPGMEMELGGFGIPVPPETMDEITPDLLLVPFLAFDDEGCRLGYGGGYYDRTLAKLRADNTDLMAVGVAYGAQKADKLPREATDQPLDLVVTEKEMIRPHRMQEPGARGKRKTT
ncbi:MAG: 5-formyltetrahydrofolate cyclo-ligase [Rhodospirillaceae bacterium]|nr:5-formyltetrahydrofolate cyclo-ligase [Rhodospirillaceae bacterium]MBT5374534.1 5-formyltetrahydrofolate cyclo-ligase [Rhodospirillaceae bacterium]MBT5659567.1 5-formyltetrahydrofolate cyclo-ligase [Rhodospirillaceae bacterium]MBT5752898.1 5-formyltetrahydrofolate cyclo-ligase [Rhodospirillaceae bacterium]MBT7944225.1 5-formyltetrahydrofolate cyclo-ligase [Alphaproteobacteria bacterium]